MTAPVIESAEAPDVGMTDIQQMNDDEFSSFIGGPPPDPGDPTPTTEPAKTPAPEAGVSVSTDGEAEETEEAEIEEVEVTPEQADQERTAAGWKKDAAGKWHKPDGSFARADELPPAAEKPAPTKRELLAQFKAKGGDGNEYSAEDIADIEVTYNANGKEVTRTWDHVVKMAQRGEYNEAERNKIIEERAEITQTRQQYESLQSEYRQMRAFVEKVLEDSEEADQVLIERRQRWAAANSPEARAERAERERDAVIARQRAETDGRAYDAASERIASAIEALHQRHPSVMPEAILGKYNVMIAPYLVNGQLPPHRLQEVERIVASDLAPWVESLHSSSESRKAEQEATTKREIDRAKGTAILAKRNLARVMKPSTGPASALPHEKPKKEPKSHDELRRQLFGGDDED